VSAPKKSAKRAPKKALKKFMSRGEE